MTHLLLTLFRLGNSNLLRRQNISYVDYDGKLCGSTKFTERDLKSKLHKDLVCEDAVLTEKLHLMWV